MKKAVLLLAIVCALSVFVCTDARAQTLNWLVGTVVGISNGFGVSMMTVHGGTPPADTTFSLDSRYEKQMLALAMYAQSNGKQVSIGINGPLTAGQPVFALYVLP